MYKKYSLFISAILFIQTLSVCQNIKTIQLKPVDNNSYTPIVRLGSVLELSFDDLDADNQEYQYKVEHMTYDWKLSDILPSQYINGYETDYINNITNSFNTLQNYTHYTVNIPNSNTQIKKSGNYLISVIDENDEIVFSRRCVFYEEKTTIGVNVLRGRNLKDISTQQTVQFSVNYPGISINNPTQETKVVLFQNNNWNTAINNLEPQFYKSNQLIYNYTQKTNFWAGNEFLNFDTKNIRNTNLEIANIFLKDTYHHYLFTDVPRKNKPYSFNADINGSFVIRTLESENEGNTEADYTTIHFELKTNEPYINKEVYVYGDFNNFSFTKENQMTYNSKTKSYQLALSLKQGFYNYNYATISNNKIDYTSISGSFSETENEYTVIFYYRPFGEIYDRAIGVGNGYFSQNR